MKFAVLGAGAMGCLYGANLKKVGQDVTFIDVNVPHMEAINKKGLVVCRENGEEIIPIPAKKAEEYQEVADAVIVFTKSVYSEGALKSLAHAIGPDTQLISFQNGLGHERVMGKYADPDHIIIGTTNFPSDLLDNGVISTSGAGVTRMMTVSGKTTPAVQEVHDIFEKAGLNPELTEHVFAAIWEKVAFNAALNSLTSATLLPQGYLGQTKEGMELAHTIVSEVISVANKKGIAADGEHVHQNVDTLITAHFDHCPSMLQDVLKGRTTEIEFINGAVVHEAEELGMSVPVTKVLYQLVSIFQQTYPHRKTSL